MAMASPLTSGVEDGKIFGGLRLSPTDFMSTYSYGYFVPRPKELPIWSNLFLVFDARTWMLLTASVAILTLVQTVPFMVYAQDRKSLVLPHFFKIHTCTIHKVSLF